MKPFPQHIFISVLLVAFAAIVKAQGPTLLQPGPLAPFQTCLNEASTNQTLVIEGHNLLGNVTVQLPSIFEISLYPTGPYSHSLIFTPANGSVGPVMVYVRIAAFQTNSVSGPISISSLSAPTRNVLANGIITSVNPIVNIYPISPLCAGDTISIDATFQEGGPTPIFEWYVNGLAILSPPIPKLTTYLLQEGDLVSVQMTSAAACAVKNVVMSNPIKVTVNPVPAKPSPPATGIVCAGNSVALQASGIGTGNFFWYKTPSGGLPLTDPYKTAPLTSSQTYYLIDSVPSTGCKSERSEWDVLVSTCTDLSSEPGQSKASVFPNPTNGALQLELGQLYASVQIKITDATGLLLNDYQIQNTAKLDLDIQHVPGIYFMSVRADGKNFSWKILKE